MKLQPQQAAFALDIAKLILYIFEHNHTVTLSEAYRTPEQAEIYAKEGKGIKDSQHCKRLAMDLNLFDMEGNYLTDMKSYEPFGIYWQSLSEHNRWGGLFRRGDFVHFERKEQ